MTTAIALWGYGGVGKDEVGRIAIERHAFARFAKGDYIKAAVEYVDPIVAGEHGHWPLSDLLARERQPGDDWLAAHNRVKDRYPGLRRYQQRIADAVVEATGRDPWTEKLWDDIDASGCERVIMTRICLPVEARAWTDRGGIIWAVERPGYGPANDDPNEVALRDWPFDAVIANNGDLHRLARRVEDALGVAEVLGALGPPR